MRLFDGQINTEVANGSQGVSVVNQIQRGLEGVLGLQLQIDVPLTFQPFHQSQELENDLHLSDATRRSFFSV